MPALNAFGLIAFMLIALCGCGERSASGGKQDSQSLNGLAGQRFQDNTYACPVDASSLASSSDRCAKSAQHPPSPGSPSDDGSDTASAGSDDAGAEVGHDTADHGNIDSEGDSSTADGASASTGDGGGGDGNSADDGGDGGDGGVSPSDEGGADTDASDTAGSSDGQGDDGGQARSVTYVRDIQPWFKSKCAVCHRSGGNAPDLSSFLTVKAAGELSWQEISAGRMPRLGAISQNEKAAYKAWMDGGYIERSAD